MAALTALAIILLLPAADAQPAPGIASTCTWFATNSSVNFPTHGEHLTLSPARPTVPAADGHLDLRIPLASALGASDGTLAWYLPHVYPVDMAVVGDVDAIISYGVSLDVDTERVVRLFAAEPDGSLTLLGETKHRAGITDLIPESEQFHITVDEPLPAMSHLVMQLTIEGTSLAGLDIHGSSGFNTGLQNVKLQVLDSDGDGISDTRERGLGQDPLERESTQPRFVQPTKWDCYGTVAEFWCTDGHPVGCPYIPPTDTSYIETNTGAALSAVGLTLAAIALGRI